MNGRPLASILLAASLAAWSGPAHADDGDSFQRKESRDRFNEGLVLHNHDREEEALVKFREAYALYQSANGLFVVARTEQLTGDVAGAARDYRAFLKLGGGAEKERQRAQDALKILDARVGQIRVVAPAEAAIAIDDRPVVAWTDPVYVLPGEHRVTATRDGAVSERTVPVRGSEVAVADFGAEATPRTAPSPPASVTASPPPMSLERTRTDGWIAPSPWTTTRKVALVVGGAAVLAATVGVVFAAHARSERNSYEDEAARLGPAGCAGAGGDRCAALESSLDSQASGARVANVMFVGAGALALTAGVLWFVGKPAERAAPTAAWLRPTVGPASAGLQLGGTF